MTRAASGQALLLLAITTLAGCGPKPPAPSPPVTTVEIPAPHEAEASPPRKAIVLLAVHGEGLGPIACFDGEALIQGDDNRCAALLTVGAPIALDNGPATLGDLANIPCLQRGEPYEGYSVSAGDLSMADWAVLPPEAKSLVTRRQDSEIEPTEAEKKAMAEAFAKVAIEPPTPPELSFWSGMLTDVDGDGKKDRVFAAYHDGTMSGIVGSFLAIAPEKVRVLKVGAHFFPRVRGSTDLDGDGRQEVWASVSFIEGIEDSDIISAVSEELYELNSPEEDAKLDPDRDMSDGPNASVGSWGCRAF